jgi:hypothetical protein
MNRVGTAFEVKRFSKKVRQSARDEQLHISMVKEELL